MIHCKKLEERTLKDFNFIYHEKCYMLNMFKTLHNVETYQNITIPPLVCTSFVFYESLKNKFNLN
jgi:hypothetical protein